MSSTPSVPTTPSLCQQCRDERQAFFHRKQNESPHCFELFRRAIENDDQQAWACITTTFKPLLLRWIGRQTRFNPEDIVQNVWLKFVRKVKKDFQIPSSGRLDPILQYIKRCTWTEVVEMARKQPPSPLLQLETVKEQISAESQVEEQAQLRVDFIRARDTLFESKRFTEKERLLFDLKFAQRLTPREIMQHYSHLFKEYKELEVALQRITRRVRKHSDFQNLRTNFDTARRKSDVSAFLLLKADAMRRKDESVSEFCPHDDAVLLDYILGIAEAPTALSIEASAACLQRVDALHEEMHAFLIAAHRYSCPTPEALVHYVEQSTSGSERLLIFRHLEQCVRCRSDLALVKTIAADEQPAADSIFKRVIEAIHRPPLAYGLQGEWLHFHTPHLFINISARHAAEHARTWTVRLQLRSHEGELLTQNVESAVLGRLDNVAAHRLDGASGSSLIFPKVEAGRYYLLLTLQEEEIVIRQFSVGDGDG